MLIMLSIKSVAGSLRSLRRGVTVPAGFSATGGTEAVSGGFKYHVFTTAGTFTASSPGTIEFFMVGGGGGGGNGGDSSAGGGGAGGVVYNNNYAVTAGSYPISIGNFGGAAASGTSTTAFGYSALGGGAGSSRAGPGSPGGSGGGGAAYTEGGFPSGSATQPSANPGLSITYQIGQPGWYPNPAGSPSVSYSPTGTIHTGGSSNPNNREDQNPSFPNSSTIVSASPIGPSNFARGGSWFGSRNTYPGYGNGGAGGTGGGFSGTAGAVIIRYPA